MTEEGLEVIKLNLFSSVVQMEEQKITRSLIEKIKRVRHAYSVLMDHPLRKDKEVVSDLMRLFSVEKDAAYKYLRLAKLIIGDYNRLSKDWHRYRLNAIIERGLVIAEKKKDPNAFARLSATYGKYNELDRDEQTAIDWKQIIIQPFKVTSDPTLLGIKPVENLEEKIAALKDKYGSDIEDVEFTDVDMDKDIFIHE